MADLGENIKNIVKKGLEAIGSTANSIVDVTKQKVDEMNLQNLKKDLLSGLSQKVYDLWLQGETLPESLIPDLEEIVRVEEEIRLINDEKEPENSEESSPEEDSVQPSESIGQEENGDADVPVIEVEKTEKSKETEDCTEDDPCPLHSAIDDLFKNSDKLDEMADKVNSSLDEMGENLRKFSDNFSKELSDMANELMGKNKKDE